ncbi:phage baseplate assembly protein V [Vibrio fluvialis]|nr:phage baseplate assembly protein V [Vibrio fluvialis]MBY8295296.1 phage baseplate assembly protein V [Vibrio fluvialis]
MVMEALKRYVDKALMPLRRKIYSMVGRAIVTGVIEDLQRQNLQIRIENDESSDNIERFQDYGFSSYPPEGSEAVVLAMKGSLDQRVAVAVEKKELRPKGEQDDVFIYHADGHFIRLTKDRKLIISVAEAILEATTSFTIISPQNTIQGPLHVTEGITTDLGIDATGGITSQGTIAGADLTVGNISYLGHKHRDAENRLTGTPTVS